MAAIPLTQVWNASERVTAAKLTAATKTPIDFLMNPPRVNAFVGGNTVNVASSSSVSVLVPFDSEGWDTDAMHSTTTNSSRITINTSGQYLVSFYGRFPSNATGYRQLNFRKNSFGVTDVGSTSMSTVTVAAVNGDATFVTRTLEMTCVAGDHFELFAQQNSGATLAMQQGQRVTGMEFRWLGI